MSDPRGADSPCASVARRWRAWALNRQCDGLRPARNRLPVGAWCACPAEVRARRETSLVVCDPRSSDGEHHGRLVAASTPPTGCAQRRRPCRLRHRLVDHRPTRRSAWEEGPLTGLRWQQTRRKQRGLRRRPVVPRSRRSRWRCKECRTVVHDVPMVAPDLSSTTVFLDFDGTITQHDSCVHLLNRTAGNSCAPSRTSRECRQRQWDLIPNRDEQELRSIVREVPLDPGFPALIEALRTAGAEVVVLSDGYGFYAEEVCADQELALISNHIDWHRWSVTFPAISASCDCPGCGTCKPAAIRAAQTGGRRTVLVGDGGPSRISPVATLADVMSALVTDREQGHSGPPSAPV